MPDNPQDQASETPANGETPQEEQPTFDAWLVEQPETLRSMITEHTGGLRSALETERQQRKDLTKQIKDLTGKLDANSDAAKQLGELSSNLDAAQKRADFYEAATAAGCIRLKPAFLVAQADKLTVGQVKEQYPELFVSARLPQTHAGGGTAIEPSPSQDMNFAIRRATGRI